MSDTSREYETAQHENLRAVYAAMRTVPEVREAVAARTTLTLTCPRDHKLFPARLAHVGDSTEYQIEPLDDHGRAGTAVVRSDTPFTARTGVCLEPGCPTLTRGGVGRCGEHGGRLAVDVDPLKSRYTCRVADCWSGSVPTARVLQVITAALIAGQTRIPVSGNYATRRKRSR